MIQRLWGKFQGAGGRFVRSSLLLAIGFAVARVLGLAFSLLLGRALPAESFGYIQYSILLAGIIGIGTQPFMQHTFARFISVKREDEAGLNEVVSTSLVLLLVITAFTLLGTAIFFAISGTINPGAVVIFLCVTIYYAYYGLARGYEDSTRLSVVFIASNFIQFLAILVSYYLINTRDTLPALIIYGTSYLGPVLYLTVVHPLPARFDRRLVRRDAAGELLRFSWPIWVSHALFTFSSSGDILLLTRFTGEAAAGAYAFTRTLGLVFDFLPTAISTLIMPRVASSTTSPRRLVLMSLGLVLGTSAVMGIGFLVVYPWFVVTFISADYLLPTLTVVLMILAQTSFGLHGVITGVVVGQNRTAVELASRVVILLSLYGGWYLLIPPCGTFGAALGSLIAGVLAVASYPVLLKVIRR